MRIQMPMAQVTSPIVGNAAVLSNPKPLAFSGDQLSIRFGQSDGHAYSIESRKLTSEAIEAGKRLKVFLDALTQLQIQGAIEPDWRDLTIRKFELDGKEYVARYKPTIPRRLDIGPFEAWEHEDRLFSGLAVLFGEKPGLFLQVEENELRLIDNKGGEKTIYRTPSWQNKDDQLQTGQILEDLRKSLGFSRLVKDYEPSLSSL